MMRTLFEHDLVDSSAWASFGLPNKEGTNAGRSVPFRGSRAACGCRRPVCSRTNRRIGIPAFCGRVLGRKGLFEGYCSEGVEQYEFRARVIVRQRNSREMSF